jgi:hypothetical protein
MMNCLTRWLHSTGVSYAIQKQKAVAQMLRSEAPGTGSHLGLSNVGARVWRLEDTTEPDDRAHIRARERERETTPDPPTKKEIDEEKP